MELIGYTCPYVPVEIITAAGFQPHCLLHGDYDLMQKGTGYARIDACPLVRANIAHILEAPDQYVALIGTTGCDMARRLFDVIGEHTDIPVFLIHMPRTDNLHIYHDEINWLVSRLERTFNISIKDAIIPEIEVWEKTRGDLREHDKKRYATPAMLPTSDFHPAACSYYQGTPFATITHSDRLATKPRVYMVGSEISYESTWFLEMLEKDVHIVGDFVCGLSQFLNVSIKEYSIDGMIHAYYNQPPCIYRRPNHRFYSHILSQLGERSCNGLIGFTLDYCDAYEFEMRKIEQTFKLPLLRIRTDYAVEKVSQLENRIAAFGELLCSRN